MSADLIERLRSQRILEAHRTTAADTVAERTSAGYREQLLFDVINALAAKDAALSEMRAELERVKGALKPFAEAARKAGYYPHSHLLATREVTIQDFRRAASALASQDEGEER